ncbi:unnamed protein product [Paramecium primaurelia]|uniref:Uncharacterized protein n=1 Tax=Paramecium primaurelia TaxID=5886 RepID=A0A8S1KTE0_PARPR|nr:unnamed protein product [Paramecium primaurelia]
MGCTQQKLSSPARNRNTESLTNDQPDVISTNNVISIQLQNQKLIEQKIKQGNHINLFIQRVVLQKHILNSTIMIRRQRNQENLFSEKEYVTSSNGCN